MSISLARGALAAATVTGALGCAPEPCAPAWTTELDGSGGALLAAWEVAHDDVWLVGGGAGRARIVRWTETAVDVAATLGVDRAETLWWIWGSPAGTLWLVGDRGLVLRGPADGSAPFTVVPTPAATDATLFGVWGSADDDVWIVGGVANQRADADDDLVLHWDGRALSRAPVPARGVALFKIWGADAGDFWVSGESGALWRRRAGAWEDHAQATAAGVLTVHGCSADEVYAVGGRHVWSWDGGRWTELADLPSFALATGVACGPDRVVVVGAQGLRLRRERTGGAWHDDTDAPPALADLHSAVATARGVLVVGGDYLVPLPTPRGVALRYGCR